MTEAEDRARAEAQAEEEHNRALQRLRGAMLHAVRDDARGSYLVGMELPDLDFVKAPTREAAVAYLEGQLAGVRQVFLNWWDQEHGS